MTAVTTSNPELAGIVNYASSVILEIPRSNANIVVVHVSSIVAPKAVVVRVLGSITDSAITDNKRSKMVELLRVV